MTRVRDVVQVGATQVHGEGQYGEEEAELLVSKQAETRQVELLAS